MFISFDSLGYVLDIGPFDLQALVQLVRPHLLLEHNDRLHQRVEGLMQLLPRVPQQVIRQLEPYLQHGELLQYLWRDIPQFLLVPDALLQKLVDLLLVILNVVNREDLGVGIPAEQPQVLVGLVDQVLVDPRHDGCALALVGEQDVALDFLDDLDHVYLLGGDDVADVGVDERIFLEDLLVFEVDGLLPLVLRVVVEGLEAEVLAVVDDVVVLADYHPLTCLELVDGDLVVVEEVLLVLLELQEILGVGGSDLFQVPGVGVFYSGGHVLLVDEVEVIKEGNVLEGLVDGALELRQNALLDGAFQLIPQGLGSRVFVLVEEEDVLGGEVFVGLEDDAIATDGEQLVQLLDWELIGDQRAAELDVVERDMDEWGLLVDVLAIGVALGEVIGLSVGLSDVVKLVLVKGTPDHDAAHLQKVMVLLMEIPLLPACLLSEQVYIDSPLDPLIRLLLILPQGIQHLVVLEPICVDLTDIGLRIRLSPEPSLLHFRRQLF